MCARTILRRVLPPAKTKHLAAITDPKEVDPLLRVLDGYPGTLPVRCALRLALGPALIGQRWWKVDRRNPVDAAQRVSGLARPFGRIAGDHAMRPGRGRIAAMLCTAIASAWLAACGDTGTGPAAANRAPEAVGPIPDREVLLGDSVTVDALAYFSDPDGDSLRFAAQSSDIDVVLTAVDGTAVTARAARQGTATVTVTATDPGGLEAAQIFQITVPNRAPEAVGAIPADTLEVGDSVLVDVSAHFADPDGDTLTIAASSSDTMVAATRVSGDTVAVAAVAKGTVTVTVTATDPGGLEAAQIFQITVPNRAPEAVGAIPADTLEVGDSVLVDVSAHFTDPDGDTLTIAASSSDTMVAATRVSGDTVIVLAVAKGTAAVTVTATDPEGLEASATFEVQVPNQTPQPVAAIPDADLTDGSLTLDASSYFDDPDGDALVYAAESSAPRVATASVLGATVTVVPVARGSATISVSARDAEGSQATQEFGVTVPNQAPVAVGTIPDQDLADRRYTVDVSPYFRDPEGESLDYSVRTGNQRVATASNFGSSVTVMAVARGTATIIAIARDPARLEVTQEFTVTVPNSAPRSVGRIPDLVVVEGDESELSLSPYFTDPDRDMLDYDVRSSDSDIVSAEIDGTNVQFKGQDVGSATIAVIARDPDGLEAEQEFEVKVEEPHDGFELVLAFSDSVPSSRRSAIRAAAREWMAILANTDLPNVPVNDQLSCRGLQTDETIDSVDDMFIMVHAESVDGPQGTLALAGMCGLRSSPYLPYYGVVVFDTDDMDLLSQHGDLRELAFHEMAHALGFGLLWRSHDLLAGGTTDPHFTGRRAVSAFDAAGGASYTGEKVPVEGRHWRRSVFGDEIMVSTNALGHREPYSAVTLRSMADLGYSVNASLADPYQLPTQAPLRAEGEGDAPIVDLRDDIRTGPVQVVDENGRVVRMILPDRSSATSMPDRTVPILVRASGSE